MMETYDTAQRSCRLFIGAIIGLMIGSAVLCWSQVQARNTSLLKNRVIRRCENQHLQSILSAVDAQSPCEAVEKIDGFGQLLDALQADTIADACKNINQVRVEFKEVISQMQDEMWHIFNALGVDNLEHALEKIEYLQGSYDQLVNLAKQITS